MKEKKCTYTCINLQAQWLPCHRSGDARGPHVHRAVSLEEDLFLHPSWRTQRGEHPDFSNQIPQISHF